MDVSKSLSRGVTNTQPLMKSIDLVMLYSILEYNNQLEKIMEKPTG